MERYEAAFDHRSQCLKDKWKECDEEVASNLQIMQRKVTVKIRD